MEVLGRAGALILGFTSCQDMGKARPGVTLWMRLAVKVTDAEWKLDRKGAGFKETSECGRRLLMSDVA